MEQKQTSTAPLQWSFHPITAEDIPALKATLSAYPGLNSDYSTANLFSWSHVHNTQITIENQMLFVRYALDGREHVFLFPVGNGDSGAAIAALIAHQRALGAQSLTLMCDEAQLQQLPEGFSWELARDYCDYVFDFQALRAAVGKRFRTVRWHVSVFDKNYQASFVPFCEDNIQDVFEITRRCMDGKEEAMAESLEEEWGSIEKLIAQRQALGIFGMLMYDGQTVIGAALASLTRPELMDLHVLKCDISYAGVKDRLVHEFLNSLPEDCGIKLVNMEEDLGIPGLRKTKSDTRPDILANQYLAVMELNA